MADDKPKPLGPGALAALAKKAATVTPGAAAQTEIEGQRRLGILPPRGPLGTAFEVMGRPAASLFAMLQAPPGEAASEAWEGLKGNREASQAEAWEKLIPYQEGERVGGIRSVGRTIGMIGTDPMTPVSVGPLTAAGRAAKAATPAKFLGATAQRLSKTEQIKQGLASSVGLRVPFTKPTLSLKTIGLGKVDAAAAAATQAGLEKLGQTFKAITYRGPGKTVTDWLRNAFDPSGATEVTKAIRQGAEGAAEAVRESVFDDVFFTAGIEKTAEDIAAQVTPAAGRIVEPGEVFAQAWDYWENAKRDPARFADTPEPIRQFGDVIGSKFDELLQYQRGAGMDAPELQVPQRAVRGKAIEEIRGLKEEAAAGGLRPRHGGGMREELRKRPGEAPSYFVPENAAQDIRQRLASSVVKTDAGDPRLVYHGTNTAFEQFDPGTAKSEGLFGPGVYFTENRDVASGYASGFEKTRESASNVRQQYLDIKKPLRLDAPYDAPMWGRIGDRLKKRLLATDKPHPGADVLEVGAWRQLQKDPSLVKELDERISILKSGREIYDNDGEVITTNEGAYLWLVQDLIEGKYGSSGTLTTPGALRIARRALNDAIQEEGFDGLTHIGGGRVGGRRGDSPTMHRVWIAFRGDQAIPGTAKGPLSKIEQLRRQRLANDLNAKITATIDNTLIDPRYLPVVFNKAGLKFLGVTEDEARALALFGDMNPATIGIKAKDRFHKARTFVFPEGHPRAGTHLGAADIDRMAREGTLPGYEGRKSGESIVDIGPRAVFARLYSGRRAAEETRFLRDVAVPLGTKIRDTKHLAELERQGLQRMPGHWFLKDYAFTPEVFRELKPHLSYLVNPGPWLKAAHATAREAIRLWSEWTVLFPATIAANFVDETVRASMLGATKADFAYAMGLLKNDWAPFNKAIERAADMEPGAQFLRGLAKDRIEGLTDGKVRPEVTPGAAGPEGIAGFVKTPEGARVPHVFTPHEIIREAFARKWAGGGYRMTDLQDAIDVGLRNARKPSVMRYIFHDSGISPFSRKFLGMKPLRKLQQAADDYPRLASAVSLLRRGLTPDEVSGEMGRFHPNVVLTPFERKVRNTVAPFYRWMRFAVPYAFRVTLERPTLPYLTWKAQQYLGLGGPRLEESDVPEYLRQLTGVPFSWARDENGDTVLSTMSGNRMLSFMSILNYTDPKSAADTAYGLIFPALTYLAEMDTVSDKDDVFLGVRMSNKMATFARRMFRYGNILDQMMLPKGQSETEKSIRRRDAMLRMFSPVSISTSVAGDENRFKRYKIEKAMKDAKAWRARTLSQFGRVRGTAKEEDVNREFDEMMADLLKQYEALPQVTEPAPPFLQGAPR